MSVASNSLQVCAWGLLPGGVGQFSPILWIASRYIRMKTALAWLESLGWNVAHGPDIVPDTSGTERGDYGAVVLERRLRDALETNDSAVQVLGDETLRDIARELVRTVRDNVTIDWTLRENVRADLRRLVKRILRKHGYPPDKQERATRTVLEQAEVLFRGLAV